MITIKSNHEFSNIREREGNFRSMTIGKPGELIEFCVARNHLTGSLRGYVAMGREASIYGLPLGTWLSFKEGDRLEAMVNEMGERSLCTELQDATDNISFVQAGGVFRVADALSFDFRRKHSEPLKLTYASWNQPIIAGHWDIDFGRTVYLESLDGATMGNSGKPWFIGTDWHHQMLVPNMKDEPIGSTLLPAPTEGATADEVLDEGDGVALAYITMDEVFAHTHMLAKVVLAFTYHRIVTDLVPAGAR